TLATVNMDLSAYSSATLTYLVQAGGHEDLPEADDDLLIEYRNASGDWITLRNEDVAATPANLFALRVISLPPAAFHASFGFRFNAHASDNSGTFGTNAQDDWFIDNVSLVGNRPPTVKISGPTGNVTSSTNPTFAWSISDPDGNLSSANVT